MGLFDDVKCEYPLHDPEHQQREFQTKDLGCLLDRYTITRDGRLVRHAQAGRRGPSRDVEWPIHGDIRFYDFDRDKEQMIEYVARFTHGRVEWVRRLGEEESSLVEEAPETAPTGPPGPSLAGRRLTADEFEARVPEKLELVDGRIPGDEELLVLLLTSLGLGRAIELVGADVWREALSADPGGVGQAGGAAEG